MWQRTAIADATSPDWVDPVFAIFALLGSALVSSGMIAWASTVTGVVLYVLCLLAPLRTTSPLFHDYLWQTDRAPGLACYSTTSAEINIGSIPVRTGSISIWCLSVYIYVALGSGAVPHKPIIAMTSFCALVLRTGIRDRHSVGYILALT